MSFFINWEQLTEEHAQRAKDYLNDFFAGKALAAKKPDFVGEIAITALSFGTKPPRVQVLSISDPEPLPVQKTNKKHDNNKKNDRPSSSSSSSSQRLSHSVSDFRRRHSYEDSHTIAAAAHQPQISSSASSSTSGDADHSQQQRRRASVASHSQPTPAPASSLMRRRPLRLRGNFVAGALPLLLSRTVSLPPLPLPLGPSHPSLLSPSSQPSLSSSSCSSSCSSSSSSSSSSSATEAPPVLLSASASSTRSSYSPSSSPSSSYSSLSSSSSSSSQRQRLRPPRPSRNHKTTTKEKHNTEEQTHRNRGERDVEVKVLLEYQGDASMTIRTELLVNVPVPRFIRLPLELTVSQFVASGVAVVSFQEGRATLRFEREEEVEEETKAEQGEQTHVKGYDDEEIEDDEEEEEEEDAKGSKRFRRKKRMTTGPLKMVRMDLSIGDANHGVLKNVKNLEDFILEQLRKKLNETLVSPSYIVIYEEKEGAKEEETEKRGEDDVQWKQHQGRKQASGVAFG